MERLASIHHSHPSGSALGSRGPSPAPSAPNGPSPSPPPTTTPPLRRDRPAHGPLASESRATPIFSTLVVSPVKTHQKPHALQRTKHPPSSKCLAAMAHTPKRVPAWRWTPSAARLPSFGPLPGPSLTIPWGGGSPKRLLADSQLPATPPPRPERRSALLLIKALAPLCPLRRRRRGPGPRRQAFPPPPPPHRPRRRCLRRRCAAVGCAGVSGCVHPFAGILNINHDECQSE